MTYLEAVAMQISTLYKQRGVAYNKPAAMCGLNQPTINNIIRRVTKDSRAQTLHYIALGSNMALAEFLGYPKLNGYSFDEKEY